MWRRPLNSVTLAIATHRKLERVFDGTSTQVGLRMINKWRVKIIQIRIYKVKNPFMGRDQKGEREKREKQPKPFSYSTVIIIYTFNLLRLKVY